MNHEPQASAIRLKIDFAQASDPGRDPNKQVNEDSCGYAETRFGHLAVLCDGMGGHYGGKEASRTAITTIFEVFEQMPANMTGAQALKAAIEEAGRRVYQLGGPPDNRTRPGSTVVAMLLGDKGLDVAHVGDSRAYIIRSNQIYPLTRDHSMVQGMIDAGMLTEESAMGHPDSNKITRALGMRPDVDVELRPDCMELFPGDLLLQSSDGLTDLALGREILGATRQALSSGGVEHACNMLVQMANDRGGHDNITVQILRVAEVAPKVSTTIPERPAAAQAHVHAVAAAAAAAQVGPAQTVTMPVPYAAPSPTFSNQVAPASVRNPAVAPQAAGAWAAAAQPVRPTHPGTAQAAPAYGAPGAAPQPTNPPESGGHRPTLNDTAFVPGAWNNTAFVAAIPSPAPPLASPASPASPAPLAAYRVEAGGALPLPPAAGSTAPGPTRPPMMNAPASPTFSGTPAQPPVGAPAAPGFGSPPAAPGFGAAPAPAFGNPPPAPGFGAAPPAPAFGSPAAAPAFTRPGLAPYADAGGAPLVVSRGGIVFVILGLSAVIAVLIIIVLWLVLRST